MVKPVNILIKISEELITNIESICSQNNLLVESWIEDAIKYYLLNQKKKSEYSLVQIVQGYTEMGLINIELAREYF